MLRKFPDNSVVRTPHPPCQGPGFDPWSQGRGSLVGCCLRGHTESDTTEATQQQQQQVTKILQAKWYSQKIKMPDIQ